jgi:DNA processing protein
MNKYLIDCIRILKTPGIGPVSYHLLKQKYKKPEAIIEALMAAGKSVGTYENAIEEIKNHQNFHSLLVEESMDDYPKKLLPYSKMFPLISLKGQVQLLEGPTIGIVGARKASMVGKEYTKILTKRLRQKYNTVSGLAIGIDTVVAENSIENHIGVVPGGINVVYPSSAHNLYKSIGDNGGCLISCQPFDTQPKKTLFPIRNQLIAALSDGLIITEAKSKSGSLQTAQFMLDYHKPLLVVPGHPLDENYSGNNLLLKNPLVKTINDDVNLDDILKKNTMFFDDSYWNSASGTIDITKNNPSLKEEILSMVSLVPLDINHLSHYLNNPIGTILSACIQLEMEEKILITAKMEIIKNFYTFYNEEE